jgi:hypothetical protein
MLTGMVAGLDQADVQNLIATLAEKRAVSSLAHHQRLLGQNNSYSTPLKKSRRDINRVKILLDF